MNLTNYYWYFKSVIPERICNDIVRYGKSIQDQIAVTGGFVPIGVKEKADDVPAMLSKNEFVLTADAVRGIGGGSVEKGSEKLYNLMKTAEQVGRA